MFGLSFTELAIVAVVALLLLGPDQLPSMAKSIGKTLRDLRRTGDDLRRTFETEMVRMERQVNAEPVKPAPKRALASAGVAPPGSLDTAQRDSLAPAAPLDPLDPLHPPLAPLAPAAPLHWSTAPTSEPLPEEQPVWAKRPEEPRPLALDPATLRARLRRGALPLSPSAMRAHVRSVTAREKELAASERAAAPENTAASTPSTESTAARPTAPESTSVPTPVPESTAAPTTLPESPTVRATPPMTIPRGKKGGFVA